MANVMSVASAAHVKILSWGKILALNIRCFVKNVLSVTVLRRFFVNEELIVKNCVKGQKGLLLDTLEE